MQNRITVIPADKIIQVDGHGLNFNFPAPANMHALQWHDGTGHIEYTDGQANRPLTAADYDVEVAPFTALWQAEYDRLEEERNRPLTPEEIAQNAYAAAVREADVILTARTQRQLVQAEDFTPAEFAALARAGLFPVWTVGTAYAAGNRLVYEGVVYETQQPVTAQAHQPPGSAGMLAIYRPISADPDTGAEPDGSREKPIPFIIGMDTFKDKYYTWNEKLYLALQNAVPCIWEPQDASALFKVV